MSPPKNLVCVGAFASAHGVKGAIKIKAFTENPHDVAAYGPVQTEDGARRFTLKVIRDLPNGCVLAMASEIQSREDAKSLSGSKLYITRDALPDPADEDDFYTEDLVGLAAFESDGAPLGVVTAVFNFGAGDLLELKRVPGVKGAPLIPFTKEAVPTINLAGGSLIIASAFSPLRQEDDPDQTADQEGGEYRCKPTSGEDEDAID